MKNDAIPLKILPIVVEMEQYVKGEMFFQKGREITFMKDGTNPPLRGITFFDKGGRNRLLSSLISDLIVSFG